jgi:hypothetical protein
MYKYFLGKGNNSRLIRRLFDMRPWWKPCKTAAKAHLVWTQGRIKTYLAALPDMPRDASRTLPHEIDQTTKAPDILANVRIPKAGIANIKGELIDFRQHKHAKIVEAPSFRLLT